MADPTGLASLGLDGLGHLLRLRKHRARWKECLVQLSTQVEAADMLLRSKEFFPEDADIYDEVLVSLVRQAIEVLERARNRKIVSTAVHVVLHAKDDVERVERLLIKLQGSAAEIESRRLARDAQRIRLKLQVLEAHGIKVAQDTALLHQSMRFIFISIYSAAFL